MNTPQRAHEVFEQWNRMQRHLWEGWLAASGGERPTLPAPLLRESVELGESMIDAALQMQIEAAHTWARMLESSSGGNQALADSAHRLESMADEWTRVRRSAWHGFFEAVKDMAEEGGGGKATATPPTTSAFLELWQDAAERMLAAQRAWVERVSEAAGQGEPERRGGKHEPAAGAAKAKTKARGGR